MSKMIDFVNEHGPRLEKHIFLSNTLSREYINPDARAEFRNWIRLFLAVAYRRGYDHATNEIKETEGLAQKRNGGSPKETGKAKRLRKSIKANERSKAAKRRK